LLTPDRGKIPTRRVKRESSKICIHIARRNDGVLGGGQLTSQKQHGGWGAGPCCRKSQSLSIDENCSGNAGLKTSGTERQTPINDSNITVQKRSERDSKQSLLSKTQPHEKTPTQVTRGSPRCARMYTIWAALQKPQVTR